VEIQPSLFNFLGKQNSQKNLYEKNWIKKTLIVITSLRIQFGRFF
jgi:hypothetical protein